MSHFTREELLALHEELCDRGRRIMQAKNQDYTAGGGVFDNFKNSEVFGVPGELGLLLRVMDKLMRLKSFLVNGILVVKGEGVEDAIIDVINYMVMLDGMIKARRGMTNPPAQNV